MKAEINGRVVDVALCPQKGPQTEFLKSEADITIYGGAAGGGKTYGLLLDFARYQTISSIEAVCFRRTMPQILNAGGLWDTSHEVYRMLNGEPRQSPRHSWTMPGGSRLSFAQLEHEDSVHNFQGSQMAIIYFDELTHFTKKQFIYMLSRNRSAAGKIRPYVRATCNPEKNSFVRELVDPWIGEDGFPIPNASKKIYYMYHINDEFFIEDNSDKLRDMFPEMPVPPKSLQFIPAKVEDNKILMENDPGYLANLLSLGSTDRQKLKEGNWNVSEESGDYFKRENFEIIPSDKILSPNRLTIRFWDRAGTSAKEVQERKANPDVQAETASVKNEF